MQNNLIRIPRKAFRRASQDRKTRLNLPINERQTLLAIRCMLSRWSEASLMGSKAGNGKSKSELVGEGLTMILLAAEGEEEEMKRR
jgi:hypothetical protein